VQFNIAIVARTGTASTLARSAALIGAVTAIVFLMRPDLDLDVARLFVLGDGSFVGKTGGITPLVRDLFKAVYLVTLIAAMISLVVTLRRSYGRSSLSSTVAIYLALCLTVGPGLVANLVLKEHSGRARPIQISEFGGTKPFSAVLVPATHCHRNCSFISGEASSMFVIFFAAAPIVPQWSAILIATGTVFGLAAGIVRMAQGAHFLSDVIFAGIFMALVVAAIHWAVFARRTPRSVDLKLTAVSQ
jgi:lipid A 4'-phosphatase